MKVKSFIEKYRGFLFVLIGLGGIFLLSNLNQQSNVEVLTTSVIAYEESSYSTTDETLIYVDIKGAVLYPGVYVCGTNMRIADVVNQAGGLLDNADVSELNMSKTLYDQMVINVPFSDGYTSSDLSSSTYYYIDVKGAILYPGVYQVQSGSRISDVFELAGGLLENADISSINRSLKVVDEMVLFIPFIDDEVIDSSFKVTILGEVAFPGEYYMDTTNTLNDLVSAAGGFTENADTSELYLQMTLFESFQITIKSMDTVNTTSDSDSDLVNINTASLDELMTLSGIGIILGQRIIDYRAEFGFFECIEDVMNVSGIKESIYGSIKDYIKV